MMNFINLLPRGRVRTQQCTRGASIHATSGTGVDLILWLVSYIGSSLRPRRQWLTATNAYNIGWRQPGAYIPLFRFLLCLTAT